MKGTGAALLNLYRKGLVEQDSAILIYYDDILSDIDLSEMLAQHDDEGAVATLALARSYQVPVGVTEVKGNRLVKWAEKPSLETPVGAMALDDGALDELPQLSKDRKELDITRD